MSVEAAASIRALRDRGCDYTLLWFARHWDLMQTFEYGRKLTGFLESDLRLHRAQVTSPEFQGEVTAEFSRRKIENLYPDRMVKAYYKEELFGLEIGQAWPEPYFPFLVQMRPGPFHLFFSWQTAFHWIRYRAIHPPVEGDPPLMYECQPPPSRAPVRIILDCDAHVDEFGGRLSAQEIESIVEEIPVFFVTELARIRAIGMRDVVTVVEKNKSRAGKVSRHYIFNILGISTRDIRAVLHKILVEPYQAERAEYNRRKRAANQHDQPALKNPTQKHDQPAFTKPTKKQAKAKAKCLDAWGHVDTSGGKRFPCALLTDASTMHGRNQFSVPFCGKKGEPPPRITHVWRIGAGGSEVRRMELKGSEERRHPTHARALDLLGLACFSNPTPDAITLDPRFMTQEDQAVSLGSGLIWDHVYSGNSLL